MARRITIIIEEDDTPLRPRQRLYDRLDIAQQQALERARQRADYIARCGCNPLNGGSGVCGCVPPSDITWSSGTLCSGL